MADTPKPPTKAIAPKKPGATTPPTTPATGKKTDPKKPDPAAKSKEGEKDKKPAATTKPAIPKQNYKGPSPIQFQHRDIRGQPDYLPVKIVILTGPYTGLKLDLGIAINEVSHSESSTWESQAGDKKNAGIGIRPGLNFTGITTREISFNLTFYDTTHDISHLVENLKHIAQIGESEKATPKLLFIQGDLRAVECVCVDLKDKYSEPLPGLIKGFRKCEVDLNLKLIGGAGNPNALGGPLTSTPLEDQRSKTTQAAQQKKARLFRIQELMAPCLKAAGSQELEKLVQSDQMADLEAISRLSPDVFVQSAIAGVFSAETLKSERLQSKLKQDLALVMSQNENGIANTNGVRNFATALASGNASLLPKNIQDQLALTTPDFNLILGHVKSQTLDEKSEIYDREKNPTAGERLYGLGSCGLQLRRSGGAALKPIDKDDAAVLKKINDFFKGKPSDEDVKKRFGLETESQIRTVKNGQPYQSKEQFLNHSSQNSAGMTGYSLWSKFNEESKSTTPAS